MAAKKALPQKTGGLDKKSPGTPQKRTRKNMSRGELLELQDARMRRIWSVVLFAVGILFLCIALIEGEDNNLWAILHNVMYAILSWGAFFVGPLLIVISILGASNRADIIVSNKVWQIVILVVLICTAIEVCHPETAMQFAGEEALSEMSQEDFLRAKEIQDMGIIDQVIALATDAMKLEGGGIISMPIAWPLMALMGDSGARITIFLVLFVFIMLITGLTLVDLFRAVQKPVKKMETKYRESKERRAAATYDVPLGPEDRLPAHPVQSPRGPEDADAEFFRGPGRKNENRARAAKEKLVGQPAAQQRPNPRAYDIPLGDEPPTKVVPDKQPKAAPVPVQQPAQPMPTDSRFAPAAFEGEKPDAGTVEERMAFDSLIHQVAGKQKAKAEEPVEPMKIDVAQPTDESYVSPNTALLDRPAAVNEEDITEELRSNATLLVDTLQSFGVQTRIVDISRGPSVTRYELQPSAGVKISKITGLADDITLNLATAGVRIEAPIPNKAAVGIEVPNKLVSTVHICEMLEAPVFTGAKSRLTVALGKDIEGKTVVTDIAKMPHLLIAGSTGSGKSICINSFLISLLYKATPDEVRLLLVDPKVVELGVYNGIPHLLIPVVTDPRKAAGALAWAVNEMLKRYQIFAENSVRDLAGYNELARSRPELNLNPLPQIVIVIDELADLMMAAPNDVESSICRLAQMARAAGMHLIIATQRPSVDVITGIIKANIPSRIAFMVASQVDSRTILDSAGAEKLLGRGDMLFFPVGANKPTRIQGCYVSDHEVERVVTFIKNQGVCEYDQQVIEDIERQTVADKSDDASGASDDGGEEDELLRDAMEIVIDAGQASTSLLQRKLKVGYARAGRLVDELEKRGVVGPFEGSKPRQVLMTRQQFLEMEMHTED